MLLHLCVIQFIWSFYVCKCKLLFQYSDLPCGFIQQEYFGILSKARN